MVGPVCWLLQRAMQSHTASFVLLISSAICRRAECWSSTRSTYTSCSSMVIGSVLSVCHGTWIRSDPMWPFWTFTRNWLDPSPTKFLCTSRRRESVSHAQAARSRLRQQAGGRTATDSPLHQLQVPQHTVARQARGQRRSDGRRRRRRRVQWRGAGRRASRASRQQQRESERPSSSPAKRAPGGISSSALPSGTHTFPSQSARLRLSPSTRRTYSAK